MIAQQAERNVEHLVAVTGDDLHKGGLVPGIEAADQRGVVQRLPAGQGRARGTIGNRGQGGGGNFGDHNYRPRLSEPPARENGVLC